MLTNIVSPENEKTLSEISQSLNVTFSFALFDEATGVAKRLHEWCKCRDFLGDSIFANKYGTHFELYYFVTNKERVPIHPDSTQLLLKFPTADSKNTFLKNVKEILHPYEESIGLRKTVVVRFKDKAVNELLVIADKFWQQKIFTISLYSFLIKVCSYKYTVSTEWFKELTARTKTETWYIRGKQKEFDQLMLNLNDIAASSALISGWEDEETKNTGTIHNSSGFSTLFMNHQYSANNKFTQKFKEYL